MVESMKIETYARYMPYMPCTSHAGSRLARSCIDIDRTFPCNLTFWNALCHYVMLVLNTRMGFLQTGLTKNQTMKLLILQTFMTSEFRLYTSDRGIGIC